MVYLGDFFRLLMVHSLAGWWRVVRRRGGLGAHAPLTSQAMQHRAHRPSGGGRGQTDEKWGRVWLLEAGAAASLGSLSRQSD